MEESLAKIISKIRLILLANPRFTTHGERISTIAQQDGMTELYDASWETIERQNQ